MLGFGLVNSAVHEICLSQIILSFLTRSSVFLANFYLLNYVRLISGTLSDNDKEKLIELFLKEEKFLSKKINDEKLKNNDPSYDPNFDENEIIYKYLLSANLVQNKDYDFDSKKIPEIIEDGKECLKTIFFNVYEKFLSYSSDLSGGKIIQKQIPKTGNQTQDYLLEIIQNSTFIFANSSILNYLGYTDPLILGGLGKLGSTLYSAPGEEEANYDSKNEKARYYTTTGKFYNSGEVKPILFGEFYYTLKKDEKILDKMFNNFQQQINADINGGSMLGQENKFIFGGIREIFKYKAENNFKKEYFSSLDVGQTTFNYEKEPKDSQGFGWFCPIGGFYILKNYNFSFTELEEFNTLIGESGLNEKIEDYFDLNFRIMFCLNSDIPRNTYEADGLNNHHMYELVKKDPSLEDQFVLELKGLNPYNFSETSKNIYLYNKENITCLSNTPGKDSYGIGKQVPNLLYNKFYIYPQIMKDPPKGFHTKVPPMEELFDTYVDSFYTKCLEQSKLYFDKKFEDSFLFKMIFKKEGLVITADDYKCSFCVDSSEDKTIAPVYNKFSKGVYDEDGKTFLYKPGGSTVAKLKINNLITLIDMKVNTTGNNIYFSDTSNPYEGLINIRETYYQDILNQITLKLDGPDGFFLKTILDSLNFDNIEKLSINLEDFTNEVIKNYLDNKDDIFNFYNLNIINGEQLPGSKTTISLLSLREFALSILEKQIRALENG